MTVEQPDTITYTPSQSGEIPPVLDAIQMQVQIEELNIHGDPGDVDRSFIDGYTKGIAYTMAVTDPFCEEPADANLWRACARTHDAGPHNTRPFPRMRAWLDYFQRAAADLAREL